MVRTNLSKRRERIKIISIFLSLAVCAATFADESFSIEDSPNETAGTNVSVKMDNENYTANDLQSKMQKFKKMKTNGFIMAGIGAGLVIFGIIGMANADWQTNKSAGNVQVTTQDAIGGVGIVSMGFGVPCTVAGLVLGGIGSKKELEYKTRYENFSLHYRGYDRKISALVTFQIRG